MVQPYFSIAATIRRLSGLNPLMVYYGLHWLLFIGAAWALLEAFRTLLPRNGQLRWAALVSISCLPLGLFVPGTWSRGALAFAFDTADALTRTDS